MSKLTLTRIGPIAESVRLEDSPRQAGPGELLVAMEAAPLNPTDFFYAEGTYAVRPNPPVPLGGEGVGRVLAAGSAAHAPLVGRRVVILPTYRQGTWADRVLAPVDSVIPVGDGTDPLQLAMLPINPPTAHLILTRHADLTAGDWVGLNLANSAAGRYTLTLARRAGVKTLAVVRSEEAAEQVRAVGADRVLVDDGTDAGKLAERVKEALDGAELRLALDGVGGAAAQGLAAGLGFGGTLVPFASTTGADVSLPVADSVFRDLRIRGFWLINWLRHSPRAEIEAVYRELEALVADGTLKAPVEATYPLEEYQTAFEHARRAGRGGKVLFTFEGAE